MNLAVKQKLMISLQMTEKQARTKEIKQKDKGEFAFYE